MATTEQLDHPPAAELTERTRAAHRHYPTGVTVVTVSVDGQPYGLAVNAFSSVSLDPPVVLACVARTAVTYGPLLQTDALAINILAFDQADVAHAFARSGGDKFAGLAWRPGANGAPLIEGASATLEGEVTSRVPVHTHTIFVSSVVAAHVSGRPPLVYLGGAFYDGAAMAGAAVGPPS